MSGRQEMAARGERNDDDGDDDGRDPYRFEGLPLEPIPAGQNVLVAGPPHVGARKLVLRMVAGSLTDEESAIVVTTDSDSDSVFEDCRRLGSPPQDDAVGVVDCAGGDSDSPPGGRVLAVSGPEDLTGIGMRYSKLCTEFDTEGVERIRMGVSSISTLLSFGDVQRTSRFVHTLAGRNASIDGLGVFLLDPETQDQRTVSTIAHFCDGRIQVRAADDGRAELRVRGVPGPREWTAFDPGGR